MHYHLNVKLHDRPSSVVGHLVDFLSTRKTREMLLKYTVTKATFLKVLRCLLHISWVTTTRSTKENFVSLKFEEVCIN